MKNVVLKLIGGTRGVGASLVFLLVIGMLITGRGRAIGFVQPDAPLKMASAGQAVIGRYIVVLRRDRVTSVDAVRAKVSVARGNAGVRVRHVYESVIRGYAAQISDGALAQLRKDPDVAYIEQDRVVHAIQAGNMQANPPWGLDRIDQSNLPLNESYSYDVDGAGVHAYIIDTGIRSTHAEFSGRVGEGFDAVDGGDPDDCNGHGTHVAGTIGGTTYGVAKGVTLHGVRVLDCEGSGYDSDVIAGIDWVTVNHVKPAVANMSLGGDASDALDEAVQKSVEAGVVHVVAAGNESTNACNGSPSREPSALTVGATDSGDQRAWFSNYGACLDLFAPGVDIESAWFTDDSATASLSGTSMASPHAAGAAVLYLARFPSAEPAVVMAALTEAAVSGVVADVQAGSPNLLLQIGALTPPASPTPGPSPTPRPTVTPAAPVAFDDFDSPKEITAWPYDDSEDTSAATTNYATDPTLCASGQGGASVWYSFTPSESGWLTVDTFGSSYDTVLAVFADQADELSMITCNDDNLGLQSQVGAEVEAGRTYYIEVADYLWDSDSENRSKPRRAAAIRAGGLLNLHAELEVGVVATPTPAIDLTPEPPPSETPDPNSSDPQILDLYPREGFSSVYTWLYISGVGFTDPMSVTLNDVAIESVYFGSENMLYALVPEGMAPGAYTLHVCAVDGRCSALSDIFTIIDGSAPGLWSITPNRTRVGVQTEIYLYGHNLTDEMTVTIGGLPVESMQMLAGGGEIRAISPADLPAGVHDVQMVHATGTVTLYGAFTVIGDEDQTSDWWASDEDLWLSPSMVRNGDAVQIGLNVHRAGGEMTEQSDVSFYLIVDGVPELLDRVLTPPIPAGTESIDTASMTWVVSGMTDSFTVMAVIDEDGRSTDSNRENNIVTRTVSILPAMTDEDAPWVSSFTVNDGAVETADRQVTIAVGVTETTSAMYIVEREFNTAAGLWIPIQSTGWISYESAFPLTLTGSSGLRYVQAWVSDESGNISSNSGFVGINYNAAPERLMLGQVRMFRYPMTEGQSVTVTLETLSGDADLYVWNPDGSSADWSIVPSTGTDQVVIAATMSGEYQVEVYGYEAGEYRMTIEYGVGARPSARLSARSSAKTVRSAPVVQPASRPAGSIALPNAPIGGVLPQPNITTPTPAPTMTPAPGSQKIYVPILIR